MKNIKKQGFTLVELIVVITILAILGSIAFISLQGYSSDARNSKRNSDLGSIQSAMSTQLAQGQSILSFATPIVNNAVANTAGSLAGTGTLLAVDYQAGSINYSALPVKAEDFKDPNGQPYVVAVTTKSNGRYELSATVEQGAGSKVAKVIGNYSPRISTDITRASTGVLVWTGATWSSSNYYSYTLTGGTANINKFAPGDIITGVAGSTFVVTGSVSRISTDGVILTLNTGALSHGSITGFRLARDEMKGLISDNKDGAGSTNDTTTIVTEGSTDVPY